MFPKSTLSQLEFKGPEIKVGALIVQAFDRSRREVIGEVDLQDCVGAHHFTLTF